MELIRVPAGTVVMINGYRATLSTDTYVEVRYKEMKYFVGHHIAHISEAPAQPESGWKKGDVDTASGAFTDYEKDPNYYEMGH